MSEAIIIALIGIIPSVTVAIVTIVSNNEIIKAKLDYLEGVASEYHHYEEELRWIKHEITECETKYLELKKDIDKLEHKKYNRGRTNI